MTLLGAILKKVRSKDSMSKKYTSPPPEIDDTLLEKKIFKKKVKKCPRVRAIVDSSSPYFNERQMYRSLQRWKLRVNDIYTDNMRLLFAITNAYLSGGKVDSHWNVDVPQSKQYYHNRVQNYNKINRENKEIYKLIKKTRPRVVPTSVLRKEWLYNKHAIIHTAKKPFILFPIHRCETFEDSAFEPPDGVIRPRVYITLRMKNAAVIGTIVVELFTDVCPSTCQLFLELADGDGLGHGYVGTQFFRKVPNLYWSGGDVIYNNGFGCYAQRGRLRPIAAENYHFSHSMPGLLSMQVSSEGYVCGVFNITFKPLPQFDLKNVVFGRKQSGTHGDSTEGEDERIDDQRERKPENHHDKRHGSRHDLQDAEELSPELLRYKTGQSKKLNDLYRLRNKLKYPKNKY